jgi:hypothetical protein
MLVALLVRSRTAALGPAGEGEPLPRSTTPEHYPGALSQTGEHYPVALPQTGEHLPVALPQTGDPTPPAPEDNGEYPETDQGQKGNGGQRDLLPVFCVVTRRS